jgi:hypothetical protein
VNAKSRPERRPFKSSPRGTVPRLTLPDGRVPHGAGRFVGFCEACDSSWCVCLSHEPASDTATEAFLWERIAEIAEADPDRARILAALVDARLP